MDETQTELVKAWLLKAQHDLIAIRKLSEGPEACLDTAIYHCQQAAEKSIKGFLVYRNQRFEKTHDLRILLELALPYEPRFSSLKNSAVLLTPYAAEFRYPGDFIEPSREEFEEALEATREVWDFVLSLLPPETHPKTQGTSHLPSQQSPSTDFPA